MIVWASYRFHRRVKEHDLYFLPSFHFYLFFKGGDYCASISHLFFVGSSIFSVFSAGRRVSCSCCSQIQHIVRLCVRLWKRLDVEEKKQLSLVIEWTPTW